MNISDVEAAQEAWEKAVQGMGLQLPAWHSLGPMLAALESFALSHAAGQDGEQCRAASVEDSAVNAVLTTIRRERDAWLSWNHDHPEQAAITTPDVLEMAANLIRALSRGVPEGDDSLPVPLWPVSKEWYQLCERRFAVDRITISGKLAEAIVDAVCGPAIAAQRKEG